jgi:F-type H+-transporting ATPase subunit b
MPQLDVSTFPSQLFWLGACFVVLYLILSFIAVPKITRVLETREGVIEEKINKASLYREEAEELLGEYEATLAEARKLAQERYKNVSRETISEISQKQKDFLDKLKDRQHLKEQALYRTRIELNQEIKPLAAELAVTILEKLTGRKFKQGDLLGKKKGKK